MSKKKEEPIQTGKEIAIIGMTGRFPGARNIHEFWDNLKNGVESIAFFSGIDLKDAAVEPDLINHPDYVKAKVLLEDKEYFDAAIFGYTPLEAQIMAPQMRIFHECAWEALEDAGYDPEMYDGLIGLYAGASPSSYWEALSYFSGEINEIGEFAAAQLNDKDYINTRISYNLNLKGPVFSVQTACSTSLLAVHLGCRGLLTGECKMALAGGIAIIASPKQGYLFREGMILSPDGHCRAFDAKAKGMVFGEGTGLVVLKRLKSAIADGDHIYALIKGTAINNDGKRKVGYTAPSVEGQAEVIQTALRIAQVEPETVSYIETHGTGTTLGDPVEIEALTLAFETDKKGFCAIGSVKTNIGHLDAAAGIAGLIKTVLALNKRKIPPSLHFENPNPAIDFDHSPFYVNTELKEWKNETYHLRAGVSSFGIGGTNAHAVLEEAPKLEESTGSREWKIFMLSAGTRSALEKMSLNLAGYLEKNPGINVADLAYTLQVGRKPLRNKRIGVISDVKSAIEMLSSPASQKSHDILANVGKRAVVFMFSGQGSQYPNMGLNLYQKEPVFRRGLEHCLDLLRPLVNVDIMEILYPNSHNASTTGDMIDRVEICHPLLFSIEYALATLLMKWGIVPQAMIGYSLGEYVAAAISGVLSLEDALKLVAIRGKLIQKLPPGGMLSVPLSKEELAPLLTDELSLAIDNGPSCIVSGPVKVINAFEKQMKKRKYLCIRVRTSHAIHSKMMEPILKEYERVVGQVTLKNPRIPYISNVTGKWLTVEQTLDPKYWVNHLKETVRFADGIKELLKDENTLFVEIGPGGDLGALLSRHLNNNAAHRVITTIRPPGKDMSDVYYLLNKLGFLWLEGVKINWSGFYSQESRQRISLPTYPFEGQHYWFENDRINPANVSAAAPQLRRKTDMVNWFYIPSWKRSLLSAQNYSGTGEQPGQSHWLMFMDKTGMGNRLLKLLEKKGQDIIIVRQGKEFSRVNQREYTINVQDSNDYEALLKEFKGLSKPVNKIIHLWGVTGDKTRREGIEAVENAQNLGFYSLLYLAKAISNQLLSDNLQVELITNNMQEVTGEELLCPEKATVLGPTKVIPQEFPFIICRNIDIVFPGSPGRGGWEEDRLVRQLCAEFSREPVDSVVAFRSNHRWIQAFEPVPLPPPLEKIPKLKEKGVYLITGGLGGIGLSLAEFLVRKVRARLILTGRTALPTKKEWETYLTSHKENDKTGIKIRKVKELEALGGEVLVLKADVSNRKQMSEVIKQAEEWFRGINGVIHAAGIVEGDTFKTINEIDPSECRKQFQPKVYGLLVLEEILRHKKLDFCLLTSSLSPILGGLGFIAYSAANQFMDSFVHYYNRKNPLPWISVNWADWRFKNSEEPSSLGATVAEFDITPGEGIETFERILSHCEVNQIIITAGDLYARIDQWVKLKSLRSDSNTQSQDALHLQPRPNLLNPYITPSDGLEKTLADIWENLFGFKQVGIEDNFFDLGGDSLKGMMLVNKYQKLLGEIVHINAIFEAPTVGELAAYFKKHYPQSVARLLNLEPAHTAMDTDTNKMEKVTSAKIAWFRQQLPPITLRQNRDNEKKKNPKAIFILSPPRSGSTLLRIILSGHPQLFSPPELGMLELNTLDELKTLFEAQGILRAIMQIKECSIEKAQDIVEEFKKKKMTTKQFYRLIQEWIGDKILVDKSPGYALYSEILERIEVDFENALFIHLLRHPYGMIRSYDEAKMDLLVGRRILEKHSISRVALAELIWTVSHQNIMELLKQVPQERQMRVKMEELVTEPRPVLEKICQFLGLDFFPEMLDPYKDKKLHMTDGLYSYGRMKGDVKFHTHTFTGIEARVADRWKKNYTVDFLGDVTWEVAKSFGYKRIKESSYSSIEPVEKKEYYPLSSAQKRLYFVQQINAGSTAYNMFRVFYIETGVIIERLEQIFRQLIKRHDSFRTSFILINKEPVQRIHKDVDFEIQCFNLATGGRGKEEIASDFVRPFDLSKATLLRLLLGKIDKQNYLLIMDMHHIISDGVSQDILVQNFMALYKGEELPPLKLKYKDYSEWQNKKKETPEVKRQEEYWLKEFDGEIPSLNLPTDYPRPQVQHFEGSMFGISLGAEETEGLKTLAMEEGATLYMVLISIYYVLLYKLTGQEDIVIGAATAGRGHVDIQYIIGFFLNMLALRNFPQGRKRFREFLGEVKKKVLGAFDNQEYQFEDLVDKLNLTRDTSRNPLFDVILLLQNQGFSQLEIAGLKLKTFNYQVNTSKFDLMLDAVEIDRELIVSVNFSTKLFKPASVEIFTDYFQNIISDVLKNPSANISDIEVMGEERRNALLAQLSESLEDEAKHFMAGTEIIQEKLNKCFSESKNFGAIEYGDKIVTYSELDTRSDYIANRLVHQGIKKETFIGILLNDRLELIITILGIIKAGCVFIPLDPSYPDSRLELMIDSANIEIIIADETNLNHLVRKNVVKKQQVTFLSLDQLFREADQNSQWLINKPAVQYFPGDKIYIYFTSGTTGTPKAVIGKNRSLLHSILWEIETFNITSEFRITQFTIPTFDPFLRDIFVTLGAGGVVCIPENLDIMLNPGSLVQWIIRSGIYLIRCVPGLFRLIDCKSLNKSHFKQVKYIMLSGEKTNPSDLVNWYDIFGDRIQFVNLYGPTETTLIKIYYPIQQCDVNKERIPIGKAMEGARVIILNKNMNICAPLIKGEIYIRTPFTSHGYCNDPVLNNKKFVQNPFSSDPYDVLYKTGDLGRVLPDGNIDILGRIDRQVKIRGHRIELEEIEGVLTGHTSVKEAAVIKQELPNNNELLCAYVVLKEVDNFENLSQEDNTSFVFHLTEFLAKKVPDFMIPSTIIKMDKIPRTPNGKVAYNRLPHPIQEVKRPYIIVKDEFEEKLLELWAEILGIKKEKIGVTSGFFELGGSSLNVMTLITRIHQSFDTRINLGQIFNNPTIKKQAEIIRNASKEKHRSIQPQEKKEYYALSSAQKRLYILNQMELKSTAYNMPQTVVLEGELEREKLKETFKKLITKHDSFRTSFVLIDEQPVQRVHSEVEFEIEYWELYGEVERKIHTPEKTIQDFIRPFDLSRAPLLRVGLMPFENNKYLLMVDMHHIISDGVSAQISVKEFAVLFAGKELPRLRLQYKDYSRWHNRWVESAEFQKQEQYWLKRFKGDIPVLNIPLNYSRLKASSYEGDKVNVLIEGNIKEELERLMNKTGTTLYMILLALCNLLLYKYTGQEDIIIGSVTTGRSHIDLENIIGFFINMHAVRNRIKGEQLFGEFLGEVKKNTIDALDNQDYPFDELVSKLGIKREPNRYPLVDVIFQLQNIPFEQVEVTQLQISPYRYKHNLAKFDLYFEIFEIQNAVSINIQYAASLFTRAAVENMAKNYLYILNQVLANEKTRLEQIKILPGLSTAESNPLQRDHGDFGF